MNRNSISGVSRALIAAVLLATAALSGCASSRRRIVPLRGQRRPRARSHDGRVISRVARQRGRQRGPVSLQFYKSGLTSRVRF